MVVGVLLRQLQQVDATCDEDGVRQLVAVQLEGRRRPAFGEKVHQGNHASVEADDRDDGKDLLREDGEVEKHVLFDPGAGGVVEHQLSVEDALSHRDHEEPLLDAVLLNLVAFVDECSPEQAHARHDCSHHTKHRVEVVEQGAVLLEVVLHLEVELTRGVCWLVVDREVFQRASVSV